MRTANIVVCAHLALLGPLVACSSSTEAIPIDVVHIQGRVLDIDTGAGIQGVSVKLIWGAGAFGLGGSTSVTSGADGGFDLIVDFAEDGSPAQCSMGVLGIAYIVPSGYASVLDEEPTEVECTEEVQMIDIHVRRIAP